MQIDYKQKNTPKEVIVMFLKKKQALKCIDMNNDNINARQAVRPRLVFRPCIRRLNGLNALVLCHFSAV
jgi:hypothetical protein